ncbi:ribose 5-phosphate isomerase B [Rufibacter immobilis]|uniref:Ribose 5-phosphate isomerase B n=1 Tax=Rufibacter immobilis TaxID=1348778 RepID=A0A3M9N3Q1_9BACT|nr:ribose 5-phosphate isomerase B [Rufibacter immobilis]RNI32366.1 ribose 5-phosphate isomerase B [Rufibacter immobilis]
MKIALGGDHAGFEYKGIVIQHLEAQGHEVKDFGPFSNASVDYPDFVHPLSTAVENKEYELGILICGSGNGVAITANKHAGIRAALCWAKELAELARSHNNANVLCLPARFVSQEAAKEMVDAFLTTPFEGGRHQTRVDKIACA